MPCNSAGLGGGKHIAEEAGEMPHDITVEVHGRLSTICDHVNVSAGGRIKGEERCLQQLSFRLDGVRLSSKQRSGGETPHESATSGAGNADGGKTSEMLLPIGMAIVW